MLCKIRCANGFLLCAIMMNGYASDRAPETEPIRDTKAFSINWVSYGDADSNVVQVEADTISDSVIAVDSQFTIHQDFSSCCDVLDEERNYPYFRGVECSNDQEEQPQVDTVLKRDFSVDWAAMGNSDPTILQIEATDISATIVIDGVANIEQIMSACCEQLAQQNSDKVVVLDDAAEARAVKIRLLDFQKGEHASIAWKSMNDSHPTILQLTANDMPITIITNVTFFVEVPSTSSCGIGFEQEEVDLDSFNQLADVMNDDVGEMEALEQAPRNWGTWVACKCALRTLMDLIIAKSSQLCELSGIC